MENRELNLIHIRFRKFKYKDIPLKHMNIKLAYCKSDVSESCSMYIQNQFRTSDARAPSLAVKLCSRNIRISEELELKYT